MRARTLREAPGRERHLCRCVAVRQPEQITGLGLDADWFPKERQVMTTDGVRLITIAVGWHRVAQSRRRGLAEAVARGYLGPLDHKAAEPNGS